MHVEQLPGCLGLGKTDEIRSLLRGSSRLLRRRRATPPAVVFSPRNDHRAIPLLCCLHVQTHISHYTSGAVCGSAHQRAVTGLVGWFNNRLNQRSYDSCNWKRSQLPTKLALSDQNIHREQGAENVQPRVRRGVGARAQSPTSILN
jgi:hypothetical protein